MGFIESTSERYPAGQGFVLRGKIVDPGGGVANILSILFSNYCAQRMVSWYCLHSSSASEICSEEAGWEPNEAMACPMEVSQNGASGP